MVMSAGIPIEALLFFNRANARTVDAFAAQIIPSEEGSPGAREAGVVYYIDRALAGFMRDLQPLYRRGLQALSDLAVTTFGAEFSALDDEKQRSLVETLNATAQAEPEDFSGQFYRILREHTAQGFFSDPADGGNRDVVGWKLVGFPYRKHYVDFDPNIKDRWGVPAIRITHEWDDHDANSVELFGEIKQRIAQEMGAKETWIDSPRAPYHLSTHDVGVHRMGYDPESSVTDPFGAVHEVDGLYAVGGGSFVSYGGYNPNQTIQALAYLSADRLLERFGARAD